MISMFTPTHNPRFVDDCYESILSQTFTDWEWILLINNGIELAQIPERIQQDQRVTIVKIDKVKGVGEAKALCVDHSRGDILIEFDHDDMLCPQALELVSHAFHGKPDVSFVYSNTAQINEDGSPYDGHYGKAWGWEYRIHADGYHECVTFSPHPNNISLIWYAPNHLRAFRREAYDRAGGYDREMVVLDDQDLMSRLYLQGEFVHIDKLLYLQRRYSGQTQAQKDINPKIQTGTVELHDKYITDLALKWSERQGLLALDMGAAHRKRAGFKACDIQEGPGIDFSFDANKRWPFADNSVGVIRAVDFLEHIPDKVHVIKEIYRVLAHGGMLLSMTPSTDGRGAFQDPTHCAFYNENSFWYYTKANLNKFVEGLDVRFQASRIHTGFPSDFHKENNISYVHAHLIAIKQDSRDFGGILEI